MPELPEVETVKNILNTFIVGQTISDVIVNKKGLIIGSVDSFKDGLKNQTFREVKRIGKYLIFTFESDLILLSHLRMEGKFIDSSNEEELSKFAHVIFNLSNGRRLVYEDTRQFGKMELSTKASYLTTKALQNVGPEPFVIDKDHYFKALQTKSIAIKLALLDQKLMSGLGNIYVDEVLFLSKIHPLTPAKKLSKQEVYTIIDNSIITLNKAISAGGTTVKSYHPAKGISGNFQQELLAYGRAYLPCLVCGHKMKKIFVGGRGTTFCPRCQINHFAPRLIAITGMKGAGKSTLLSYISTLGYPTFSADLIAKELYNDPQVVATLSKKLDTILKTNDDFDINLLRDFLNENPLRIKDVNELIHPLVKEKIVQIINQTTAKVVFFEIPLLFSNKIDELFTYTIGVEVNLKRQFENLLKRGTKLGPSPDKEYLKNRYKLDYILNNDGSVTDLENKFLALNLLNDN